MDKIRAVHEEITPNREIPPFTAGDTVTVTYMIKEGEKTRPQSFKGVVLQRRSFGITETFTVRKISSGQIGVERIFPVYSPNITEIKVNQRGKVRRARLFYLRQRRGKAARIKERR